ncbi:MAG: cadmium-translocating P-type ATPase [Epsilonproteobacteria bacterium]|nr:cadmium-translocating P-type ATPase [Campylobacterota bacterium]
MAKVPCSHCHLQFDEEMMIKEKEDDKTLYFCCKGCQGVYHLLKSEGLDSFYDKLGDQKLDPATQKADNEDLLKYDFEGFKNRYIKVRDDGLYEINLIIEGIHCSACVWLNEKILHKTDGIIEATINYSNHKAKVIWDPEIIKLSEIILKIRSIGYNAYPYDPSLQEARTKKEKNSFYARMLVAIFATMNIMWIAVAQYTGYFTGMEKKYKNILNIAEFVLATPTLFYSGWVFFKGAYYGLKNRFINMDFLVATGALLTYLYSIYAMITLKGEVYFDSVTMIITFVLVGKYLEVVSKKRAADTIDKILSTIPTEVYVIKDNTKSLIAVENVEIGDIIELKAGDKVVIDGIIVSGEGTFDESSITGESKPIFKKKGDEILSGSILTDSVIRYRATKRANDSLLSNITEILNDSITKKPKIEQLANKISGYFSITILTIAIITFIAWFSLTKDFEKAFIIAISVVVVACPCALGLATPMATLVGVSKAIKKGILFKEARDIETMAKSTLVALDKTGTITQGKPSVVDKEFKKEFNINYLYSLVKSSKHPISKGVASYLENNFKDLKELELDNIKNIEAKGVVATINNHQLLGGNCELFKKFNIKCDIKSNDSLFIFAIDKEIVAIFYLEDKIKPDSIKAISQIKEFGLKVVMLTGDSKEVAQKIAKKCNIDTYYAKLLPQDKADLIDKFHKDKEIVIMAGDGINDAIALSKSDIAIAMGSGADIAIEISDVVLLNDNLLSLARAIEISKRSYRAIKENLTLSIIYNTLAIPLAVAGYINPLFAALFMSLSSLIVVGNSMRIKFKKDQDE